MSFPVRVIFPSLHRAMMHPQSWLKVRRLRGRCNSLALGMVAPRCVLELANVMQQVDKGCNDSLVHVKGVQWMIMGWILEEFSNNAPKLACKFFTFFNF